MIGTIRNTEDITQNMTNYDWYNKKHWGYHLEYDRCGPYKCSLPHVTKLAGEMKEKCTFYKVR